MPQLHEICSRCKNNWMACECDNFAPPMKVTTEQLSELKPRSVLFTLTKYEAEMLLKYFYNVGYIGHEWEWDIETHKIINRIHRFVK